MKDYQSPLPSKVEYGLFLIRQTSAISEDFLSLFFEKGDSLISFERLFKGDKCTLLIYGPKNILVRFNTQLNLLEMEDYTDNINLDSIYAWEFGLRGNLAEIGNLFEDFPKLSESEQIFWQIILKPLKKGDGVFKGNIRVAVLSDDPNLKAKHVRALQNLAPQYLVKLPKAYSNKQIINFYIERSMDPTKQNLNPRQILKLLKIN